MTTSAFWILWAPFSGVGADLNFAAQYPRPRPVSHLLPGYPREDQTVMDLACDDEMFVQQGEYSHGPLVGHRVPAERPLFEARLSEKDFPWLTDHRVHHAPIMPAAGYIELILRSTARQLQPILKRSNFYSPARFPDRRFACKLPSRPVADDPDALAFTISSSSFDAGSENLVHCRGTVRRIDESITPAAERLSEFDTSDLDLVPLMSGADFYEHVEAVLGDSHSTTDLIFNRSRELRRI